jgi:phage host-nuclease inhibitor protein Gam
MTSEEFLRESINELMEELDVRIKKISYCEDCRIALFDDGKLCGFAHALGQLSWIMRNYDIQRKGSQ